jgi:hypothetical protein
MIIFTVHTADFDDVAVQVEGAFHTRMNAELAVIERINQNLDILELSPILSLASQRVTADERVDGEVHYTVTDVELYEWVITAVELV